jgi:hypothetical protein
LIDYRSNNIGYGAAWVLAASNQFHPNIEVFRQIDPKARPFDPIPPDQTRRADAVPVR